VSLEYKSKVLKTPQHLLCEIINLHIYRRNINFGTNIRIKLINLRLTFKNNGIIISEENYIKLKVALIQENIVNLKIILFLKRQDLNRFFTYTGFINQFINPLIFKAYL